MFTPQAIKTDVLLALTFLAGILGDFGVKLTSAKSDLIASDISVIAAAVMTIAPVILATYREIKHLQTPTAPVAPVAPAADPAPVAVPVAPPVIPIAPAA